MAHKQAKRKAARRTPPLTRAQLLPIPSAIARSVSLRNHMSLAILKLGEGNLEAARVLLKTIYWTFFIAEQYALTDFEASFVGADEALKACITRGEANGRYGLDAEESIHVAKVIQIHDLQLSSVPRHLLDRAEARLCKLFDSDDGFPTFRLNYKLLTSIQINL